MKEKTCCFTGHRKIEENDTEKIRDDLMHLIADLINDGVTDFVCGGALGFDTMAAQCILFFKKYNKKVRLILAIPCISQADNWSYSNRKLYEYIKSMADEVHILSDRYYHGCMQRRNRFMVDMSLYCIVYFRKDNGGTFNTVKYAQESGLNMFFL